jgi:hypothetical protein
MKHNLKTFKSLDIHSCDVKVPENVRKCFFKYCQGNYGNDCWVEYVVGECSEIAESPQILDSWLIENINVELGEKILIKHWW